MNRIPETWPAHGEADVASAPVVLAHESAISLPPLLVEPALRRVVRDDGAETIVEPLVMQVLVALARAHGDILTRDELVDRCWDGRIVGDDSIARVIALVRKLGAGFGAGAFTVETITKVGYRLIVAGEVGKSVRVARRNRIRAAGLVGATGLALALAGAALWAFALPGDAARATTTISIEPASGSARDAAARRFASALTTDLARLAGGIDNVTIIDTGSRGQPARSDYVVRVSVERERDRLAARTRLVSARDGAVLWSRTFDGEAVGVAALREQVAIGAAGVLRCGLERSATVLDDDPTSVRLFFAACDASQDEDWIRSHGFVRQVVARRPDVAAGWSCLALTWLHVNAANPVTNSGQSAAVRRTARSYALKAIQLDPHNGRGYYALANAGEQGFGSPRSIALVERGIAADPDFELLHTVFSVALFNAGYIKASVAPALRGVALDPTNLFAHGLAARPLLATGRNNEAFAIQARAERLWPRHPALASLRQWLAAESANPALALARIQHETRGGGTGTEQAVLNRRLTAGVANPASLDGARLDRESEALFRKDPRSAWSIADAMSQIGETDRAFAWLARAPVSGAQNHWAILFWPKAAPLRRDPRFFAAMARLGLVDLWRKRGQWPDFCSEPGLRYDCRVEAARLGKQTS